MRLPFFTLFLFNLTLFSLFPTLASSLHPVAFSRRRDQSRSPVPSVITSRQYRIARDLLDVCINANVNLLADVSQVLGLGSVLDPLDLGTNIELCLCLKDLDLYLETNANVQALIGLLGKNAIGSLITAVVNTSPQAQECAFPQHAHHTCNTNDPCHYECDAPYTLQGGECVCAPPYSSCNGVCDLYPQSCGSAVPRSLHKRTNAIVTIAQAKASCRPHETVCGIPGQEKALAFECIDTRSTADSCGGCMTPHPFFEAQAIRHTVGQDCTAIAYASSTGCSKERCVVGSCVDGWVPGSDKVSCVSRYERRNENA
ncbi:hypothetical protein CPB84DRAFT_986568 [Gymnopilus junonius]|uniref:Protein CPL1-like domain-containing protein n=1 Tax=Gymnopilus junonius TaxID=109634 RepID=A0A9P5NLC2_GYMJU|nr:hypothetical protein CPB84DRAFT_986568 [Gymnopilus junonius]